MWIHLFQPCLIGLLLLSCLLLSVMTDVLTSNCRYAQIFSSFRHHDEILNERADINEASPTPLVKSRTVHLVGGAR
jgi:hypothetical protein